jgi:tetratricopeptide (TPR) repeat protein
MRARYHVGYASTIWPLGSPGLARPLLEEALRLFREMGDDWWIGLAMEHSACVAGWEGRFEDERATLEESLVYAQRSGERWLIKDIRQILGWVLARLGDLEEAERLYREVSRMNYETGDVWFEAHNQADLGWLLIRRGRFTEAREALAQALEQALLFNDRFQTARVHIWLGLAALEEGNLDEARACAAKADRYYRDAGVRATWPDAPELMAEIEARAGNTDTARAYYLEALAICEAIGDRDGPDRIKARLAALHATE